MRKRRDNPLNHRSDGVQASTETGVARPLLSGGFAWGLGAGVLLAWLAWDNSSLYPYFDAKYTIWSLVGLLLAVGWFLMGGSRVKLAWLDGAWALWLVWSGISLTFLPDPHIGIVDMGQRLAVGLVYPLARFLPVPKTEVERRLFWAVAAALEIQAVAVTVQDLQSRAAGLGLWNNGRLVGTLGFHTFVGAFLVMGLPLAATLWEGSPKWARAVLIFITLHVFSTLVLLQSRAAWLALLVAAAVFARRRGVWAGALASSRVRLAVAVLLLLLALFPAGVIVLSRRTPGAMWDRTVEDLNRRDLTGRKLIWLSALHQFVANPLTGQGLGSFYYGYIPSQGEVIKDQPLKTFLPVREMVIWAHDDYLQEAVEGGLLGIGLLVLLTGGSLLRVLRGKPRDATGAALASSLAAWGVIALVDFPLHRPSETLLLFIVIGLIGRQTAAKSGKSRLVLALPARVLAAFCLLGFAVALAITGTQFFARRDLRAALAASTAGQETVARQLFQRSLRLAPNPGQTLASFGAFLCKVGQPGEGLQKMGEALHSFRDMVLYENLGKAYLNQGLTAQALTNYQLAADAGVNYLADSAIAANLEWRLGDRDGAMARLKALHAFAPRNVAVALALASDHYQQKDFQACLATLKTTIGKDDPATLNLEAAALLQLGQSAQARVVLSDLLKAHPDYAPAWTNMGALEVAEGQLEEAERTFQRAVALDPRNEVARGYLARLARLKNDQPSVGGTAGGEPYQE